MNKKILKPLILGITLQIISISLGIVLFSTIQAKTPLGTLIIISLFCLLFLFGSVINLIEAGKIIGLKNISKDFLNEKGALPINKSDNSYREHYATMKIETNGHKIKNVIIE